MNKIFFSLLVSILVLLAVRPQSARAEMPAKARAFLTIVGYGTAGGALIGVASTAFGTSSRAVAQGASLGLYAGILFGTYVLVSHHNKRYGTYDDNSSPYSNSKDIYGEEGGSGEGAGSGFFDRHMDLNVKFQQQSLSHGYKKRGSTLPPLQINLLQFNF
jgi:hypothetical protein